MLENWRKRRGDYLTQFYRELRAALNSVDPQIQIAVQIPGDRAGTCLGNWPLDWRTWIDEGLVNELVVPVVLDNYEGYGPRADLTSFGYIDAALPIEVYREFIRSSRHPTARVIQAGGPITSFDPPPPNADGWRLDTWFDLWCLNQAERWAQWRRDCTEYGHIRFIEQTFDDFPEGSDGYGGGWGDFAHRPDLRSGPGYWTTIGDGRDGKPFAQSHVVHSRPAAGKRTARAMEMTRDASGAITLQGRHHGRRDRSYYPFPGDTAISSGSATLDLWLRRFDANSACVVCLQNENDPEHRYEVGVYISPGTMGTVYFRQGGNHVASATKMSTGEWYRLSIDLDLERRTYSAEIAADSRAAESICREIEYSAKENAFNMIEIAPQGEPGSVVHLDDVSWRWKPRWQAIDPGSHVIVRDGFEDTQRGWTCRSPGSDSSSTDARARRIELRKSGTAVLPADVMMDSDVSFGPECHSLRIRGGGGIARLAPDTFMLRQDETLIVDIDVLLRSDLTHLQFTPIGSALGSDEVLIAIKTTRDDRTLFELRTIDGRWHCGGDQLTDTGAAADFDAWNHLQLALDTARKTYRISLQVVGSAPRLLHEGVWDVHHPAGTQLAVELGCLRKAPRPDGPAFDNLLVTRRP
jgi:hypothetical protein